MTGKPSWAQKTITITAPSRGCHLITGEIERQMLELKEFKVGMANVFLKHTSASITLNENVRAEKALLRGERCIGLANLVGDFAFFSGTVPYFG